MAALSKPEVIHFLDGFRKRAGFSHVEPAYAFVTRLFLERPLDGCTFFTSQAKLCIARFPTAEEWSDKPQLSIAGSASDRLRFDLSIVTDRRPVCRTTTEAVVCTLDQGLDEFDDMYAKFLAAHNTQK
jgi:hypothetical protein